MEQEHSKVVEKSKHGIFHMIFSRIGVIMVCMLLQMGVLLWLFDYFSKNISYFWWGHLLFGVVMVLVVINRSSNPTVKLPWVVLMMFSPVMGGLFYLYVETQLGYRFLNKRLDILYKETAKYVKQNETVLQSLYEQNPQVGKLADYVRKYGNFATYQHTAVQYFSLGEYKFVAMLEDLKNAKKYIFLEYFIVEPGHMWGSILEILKQKVKEGVEVRMMYDGTCAFQYLPYGYPKQMQELGIQCKMFSPLRPILSTHYNNRDHRKILVIDGIIGYTGGVNLGDEYINEKSPFGHWKDTAIRLEGDAVEGLTQMFLQMWNVTERNENYTKYLKGTNTKFPEQKGFVIPFGDSPFDEEKVGQSVYMDILYRATKYVYIMTPYLIIDNEMMTALTYAAKRGVDVKLILPHIPDKKIPFALARAHYPQLLKAGVEIFEYTPGFVHAKVFCSDDKSAVVGTINLDYRSLYLHFECGVYLYDVDVIGEIGIDFEQTVKKCQKITMKEYQKIPVTQKVVAQVLRILSPLM